MDIDGDGEADYHLPRHAMVFYPKNLLPSLLLNVTLQCTSAAIFVALEPGMTYWPAMYHCIVTATVHGSRPKSQSASHPPFTRSLHTAGE